MSSSARASDGRVRRLDAPATYHVMTALSCTPAMQAREAAGDVDPFVLAAIRRKGPQKNLSFFAFTATPKKRTIEVFGHRAGADGEPKAFHVYSMRQAIDEGFILDVLQRYTTYKAYFRISKAADEDPEVDKRKAKRAVARFMTLHPHDLAQKIRGDGGALSPVCTASDRRSGEGYGSDRIARARGAVFPRVPPLYQERGYADVGVPVAFSGPVKINGEEPVTEDQLNGFPEREMPECFSSDAYHFLIVAEKYQTGFDQPLLHTMYVDKKLDGLHAVQTLSRLNRTHSDKAQDDTFILDFVNELETIKEAFKRYHEAATIDEPTDPGQIFTLKNQLDEFRYYYAQDVDASPRCSSG